MQRLDFEGFHRFWLNPRIEDEAECGKICVQIFHIKVGILHMEYFSDVYTMMGTPHIKMCSDVKNRVRIRHKIICSDLQNRVVTRHKNVLICSK